MRETQRHPHEILLHSQLFKWHKALQSCDVVQKVLCIIIRVPRHLRVTILLPTRKKGAHEELVRGLVFKRKSIRLRGEKREDFQKVSQWLILFCELT